MHPSELFEELTKRHGTTTDTEISRLLGLTPSRVSQMRSRNHNLTARQVVSYIAKAEDRGRVLALADPIRPIVEMYEIDAISSKQDAKWELLPMGKSFPRNEAVRQHLVGAKGIYVFFDSMGRAVYAGKTEKQNLWKEMTNAYNRERSNHTAFVVAHPTTGTSFTPAHQKPRRLVKRVVYLYDTASFFSAYEVSPRLIPQLEALIVRAFCNTLTNKKMENFQQRLAKSAV
jgi:DNA-binding transcriptional regulator YdaS (Cro superfamily)